MPTIDINADRKSIYPLLIYGSFYAWLLLMTLLEDNFSFLPIPKFNALSPSSQSQLPIRYECLDLTKINSQALWLDEIAHSRKSASWWHWSHSRLDTVSSRIFFSLKFYKIYILACCSPCIPIHICIMQAQSYSEVKGLVARRSYIAGTRCGTCRGVKFHRVSHDKKCPWLMKLLDMHDRICLQGKRVPRFRQTIIVI